MSQYRPCSVAKDTSPRATPSPITVAEGPERESGGALEDIALVRPIRQPERLVQLADHPVGELMLEG